MQTYVKNNILVTGAKGQLGSFILRSLKTASPESVGYVIGVDKDDFDISDKESVDAFFSRESLFDLDCIVHCAAATDTAAIEKKPLDFYPANVLGTKNIASWCAKHKVKMIFISTDYVLSELSPIADGKLQEFPVNQYGLQKLLAEYEMHEAFKDSPASCSTVRSSWMFGNSQSSFIEKLIGAIGSGYALRRGASYQHKVVDDAFGCPTHVNDVKNAIVSIISSGSSGTFECFSRDMQMSRHEWATIIWEEFKSEVLKLNKTALAEPLVEAFKSIEICPVSSSSLSTSMRHPGKLKTFKQSLAVHNGMKDAWTHLHIASHVHDLAKVFVQNAKLEDKVDLMTLNGAGR